MYTVQDAAREAGVVPKTVRRILRRNNILPSVGHGSIYLLTDSQVEMIKHMAHPEYNPQKPSQKKRPSAKIDRHAEENDEFPALPVRRIRYTDRADIRARVTYAEKRRQRLLELMRDAGVG